MSVETPTKSPERGRSWIPSTHWSEIVRAGKRDHAALGALWEKYRPPVLVYITRLLSDRKRTGQADHQITPDEIADAFFTRFMAVDRLAKADPEKGKFRNYLRRSVSNFLSNALRRAKNAPLVVSADEPSKDGGSLTEAVSGGLTPAQEFDRAFATALLDVVWVRLEAEEAKEGRLALFLAFKPFINDATDQQQQSIAARIGISRGEAAATVHRLRRRLGELIREELQVVVDSPSDVDEELQHLMRSLSS